MMHTRLISMTLTVALVLTLAISGAWGAGKDATDNFIGKDARGPFVLTYQQIIPASETVLLAGLRQSRSLDYLIDYESGIIAFNKAVRSGLSVSVKYQCDPNAKSRAGSVTPMALNLMDGSNANLQFTMAQKVNDGTLQVSALGITSKLMSGGNTLSSRFLMDPNRGGADGKVDPFSTRSAMEFGSTVGIGGLKIKGDFLRVGEKFQNAQVYGLQQGVQKTGLNAEWNPLGGMKLAATNTRNETLTGKDKGKVDTAIGQALDYGFGKGGTFNAVRQENQTKLANGKTVTTTLQQMTLTQTFRGLQFTTMDQQKTASGTNADDKVGIRQYQVTGSLAKGLNLVTSHVTTDSEKNGKLITQVYGVDSTLNPGTRLALNYTTNDSEKNGKDSTAVMDLKTKTSGVDLALNQTSKTSDKNGSVNTTNVAIASGGGPVKLNLGMTNTLSEKGPDTQVKRFGVSSDSKTAGITANVVRTDTENAGAVTDANLGLRLNTGIATLTTGVTRKDMDKTGTETGVKAEIGTFGNLLKLRTEIVQNQYLAKDSFNKTSYGMELCPWQPLKLAASVMQQAAGKSNTDAFQAGMELNPGKSFSLKGSFAQEQKDNTLAKVTTVSTDAKPVDGLSVSGLYKNRQKSNTQDQNTVVANVSLAPAKIFELTGNYESNPEDKDSKINPITRRLVGVRTNIGALGLSGKYGSTLNLQNGQLAQTRQYGLDLKLWSHIMFSAGLTQDGVTAGPNQNTYTLKVERNVGADFTLALEGKVVAKDQSSQNQQDVSASMKAGIRF